jgi:hypothetical protein
MYEREKCRSTKNPGARKKNVKNQGAREREHKSAKFKAKKARKSASVKSFSQERESASAKPKKKARAQLCFWLGPVGPTDNENQVKMYCLRYISSLEWLGSGSGSVSNSRIHIKFKSRIRISVKVKSRIWIPFRIKRVWIRNIASHERCIDCIEKFAELF